MCSWTCECVRITVLLNAFFSELQKLLPVKLPSDEMDSSHTKTHLLLQAHFSRVALSSDYRTDLKSVLDQSLRILQVRIAIRIEA